MSNYLYFNERNININTFYNKHTLNIFCDASTTLTKKRETKFCCYEAVAVCQDIIVDKSHSIIANSTNNNAEAKALRSAVMLAIMYRDYYNHINIFSDSQISVFTIKKYLYKWEYKNGSLYNSSRTKAKNQNIFIEIYNMIKLLYNDNTKLCIFHQNGHINNDMNSLQRSRENFKKFNYIDGRIDMNFIRYISTWNNYVDNDSRLILKSSAKNNVTKDGIIFYPNSSIKHL